MADREISAAGALLMTIGVIGVIAAGSIFAVHHFDLHLDFKKLFQGSEQAAPGAPNPDLPVSRQADRTIEIEQMMALRKWLEQERFEKLNSVLDGYQRAYEKDFTHEFALIDAFASFHVTMPHYEVLLEKWARAYPNCYQPHLAAAKYYEARAWQSRGFKWRKDTTDAQMEGMRHHFVTASEKLASARKIHAKLLPAAIIQLGIHNALGEDEAEKRVIERAFAAFPYSYSLRSRAMWANQPRWGGSYRKMWSIAVDAKAQAPSYPVLTALYGAVYCEQARVFQQDDQYDKALESIQQAIAFGDRPSFFRQRASIYTYGIQNHRQALADINRAIALRPTQCSSRLMRAKIYYAQKDYAATQKELATIETFWPQDPSTQNWRRWAARNLRSHGHKSYKTDLRAALDAYTLSLSFDGQSHETYYWRGVANSKLGRYEAAEADLRQCIQLDPRYFDGYRMLDYTLARKRKWEDIIAFWDTFLEKVPDHAEAYLERSGAHYHNRNMAQAKKDLRKACDLGSEKACVQLKKVGGRS